MKLLLKKEGIQDPTFVDSDTLLSDTLKTGDLNDLTQRINDLENLYNNLILVTKSKISDEFIQNEIFNINNPIDISSLPDIESRISTPGVLYYDVTNKRLRFRSDTQWKTIII